MTDKPQGAIERSLQGDHGRFIAGYVALTPSEVADLAAEIEALQKERDALAGRCLELGRALEGSPHRGYCPMVPSIPGTCTCSHRAALRSSTEEKKP